MDILQIIIGLHLIFIVQFSFANKVFELSDKFLEVHNEGIWFIMFYAPWCGYCKRLEPVWNQVSQALYYSTIRISKVDCTRFPNVATEFKVKGFPTIMFLKEGHTYQYNGDRTKEALVEYAERMANPAIQSINNPEELRNIKKSKRTFFMYVGKEEGLVWDAYNATAYEFQPQINFYSVSHSVLELAGMSNIEPVPNVLVFKDDTFYPYTKNEPVILESRTDLDGEDYVLSSISGLNELRHWVNHERFPNMVKITAGNFHQILQVQKYIVMAVLEEDKIGRLTQSMKEYKNFLQKFSEEHRSIYHEKFLFGWTGSPELANSIAMATLPIPSLIVINATSYHHYLPEQHLEVLSPGNMTQFLNGILRNDIPAYGGTSVLTRVYRVYYDTTTTLRDMWRGNPVLMAVILGVPLGFLSLICYSIWCADIMDASDDEQNVREKED